jgi:hypothetical protein
LARYADRLLSDGERVFLRSRQHLLATIIEGRIAWAIFIAALVLVLLVTQLQPSSAGIVRQGFSWLGLALLLVGLGWLAYIYVDWYNQDYVVTNRRVLKVEGILKKRSADSSLEKINDAVLEQSLLGRMLGYGDLDILTANEQSVDRYRMLSQAQTFKRTMLDQKHALESEGFRIPAPPMRAAPEAMRPLEPAPALATPAMPAVSAEPEPASLGAPVAATPAAAPAEMGMSADDITRALGSLADLRDRGAISPEDYEAKKQELLERL